MEDFSAEQAVIGGVILDNSAIKTVLGLIKPSDFKNTRNKLVFEAALQLHEADKPIDLITLAYVLEKSGHFEEIGGYTYLAVLVDCVPTAQHISAYCRIMLDCLI